MLDQGFQLPSVPTTTTEAAVKLKEWMELVDNEAELERFSSRMVLDPYPDQKRNNVLSVQNLRLLPKGFCPKISVNICATSLLPVCYRKRFFKK